MKRLNELYDCEYDVLINGIKINSKEIEKGDLFICTKGVTTDRHDFVIDAINNGAVAIVASKKIDVDVPVIYVEDTNKELPKLCSKFYDHPEEKLKIFGVTGTDGKTSTTTIVQTLIGNDTCGYIGTNGRSCAKFNKDTDNTTPDSDKLYEYFYDFVNSGCDSVAMEASSEAFFRNRIDDIKFDISAITNITREHLNIHGSFENYIECKSRLFKQTKKNGYSILNKDDNLYETIRSSCVSKNIWTYGKGEDNTLVIADFKIHPDKTNITFKFNNKDYDVISPLLGEFNVYNLACAILIAIASGKTFEEIIPNIAKLSIKGRLDVIKNVGQNFTVMVDYAHTPNGILNLLKFVNTLDINRSIVVIGSAGERDFLKRPLMGKTVVENASYAIFTYEDPRSEDPENIIKMMVSEIEDKSKYEIIIDRREAIEKAIKIARKNDIVLILGKGNETYQKLKSGKIYFNDEEEALRALEKRYKKEKVTQ